MCACESRLRPRHASIWPAAPSTSGRSISFITARKRSTPPSACAPTSQIEPRDDDDGRDRVGRHRRAACRRRLAAALRDDDTLPLLGRLAYAFGAQGVTMRTRGESPAGAGIAGLVGAERRRVRRAGALGRLDGRPRSAARNGEERRGAGHQGAHRPSGLPPGDVRRHCGARAGRARAHARAARRRPRASSSGASSSATPARRATPAPTTGRS